MISLIGFVADTQTYYSLVEAVVAFCTLFALDGGPGADRCKEDISVPAHKNARHVCVAWLCGLRAMPRMQLVVCAPINGTSI